VNFGRAPVLFLRALAICLMATVAASAKAGDATRSLAYEMKVQRAAEAAIWAMPAVSLYDIELSIQRDLGGRFGDVAYFSEPMTSRHGFLTANDVTPYVVCALSCNDGPLVIEVPPAGEKASFFGTIVDAGQTPLADVGPTGDDKGAGGKYLFLPPGYTGDVPAGYLVYRPPTYGVHFAFRPVAKNGGTHADQAAYAQTLKVYHCRKQAVRRRRISSMRLRKRGIRCRAMISATSTISMPSFSTNPSSSGTRP